MSIDLNNWFSEYGSVPLVGQMQEDSELSGGLYIASMVICFTVSWIVAVIFSSFFLCIHICLNLIWIYLSFKYNLDDMSI